MYTSRVASMRGLNHELTETKCNLWMIQHILRTLHARAYGRGLFIRRDTFSKNPFLQVRYAHQPVHMVC